MSYLVRPEDIAIYLVKWNYVLWINHIDESIAHITLVLRKADIARVSARILLQVSTFIFGGKGITYLKINWKIDEIICSSVILVNYSQK